MSPVIVTWDLFIGLIFASFKSGKIIYVGKTVKHRDNLKLRKLNKLRNKALAGSVIICNTNLSAGLVADLQNILIISTFDRIMILRWNLKAQGHFDLTLKQQQIIFFSN